MKKRRPSYVSTHLQPEYRIVKNGPIALAESPINLEEKTIIYKYSVDGYESLNRALRDSGGKNDSVFGKLLEQALAKLPDYKGVVYRGANLDAAELARYQEAFEKNAILVEHSFISSSRSPLVGNMYGNCRFSIISSSGKSIEQFSKYDLSEKEVLFKPNCKFDVLEVTKEKDYTLITMEELVS